MKPPRLSGAISHSTALTFSHVTRNRGRSELVPSDAERALTREQFVNVPPGCFTAFLARCYRREGEGLRVLAHAMVSLCEGLAVGSNGALPAGRHLVGDGSQYTALDRYYQSVLLRSRVPINSELLI